jgi:hypothetical protein
VGHDGDARDRLEVGAQAEPMLPPAPCRFSTTTAESMTLGKRAPSARANTSLEPPAACGTTSVIVLGSAVCARAPKHASSGAAARAMASRRRREEWNVIVVSGLLSVL